MNCEPMLFYNVYWKFYCIHILSISDDFNVQVLTWITWTSRLATPASWWECQTVSAHWPACSAQSSPKWWPNTKYSFIYSFIRLTLTLKVTILSWAD